MRTLGQVVYQYPHLGLAERTLQVTVFGDDEAGYVVLNGTDEYSENEKAFIGKMILKQMNLLGR